MSEQSEAKIRQLTGGLNVQSRINYMLGVEEDVVEEIQQ